ncbi:MAG: hypothetical protein IIX45_01595 [Lachnospiraceae bacterium]|nr:hypothetical protein [Lachnospiraceae bacterium]
MKLKKGVFIAKKKNGELYFRSSFTYKSKHISLGSFLTEEDAHEAYMEASMLINTPSLSIVDYGIKKRKLAFDKWVSIINFRDNGLYFKNPIYLRPKYFEYYFDEDWPYKFDVDDLFYYSNHKIMRRGGHLFVADYGMQVNILNRYGIKNYAVKDKDYIFVNGDSYDFRYTNIKIINRYTGVTRTLENGREHFICKIHLNGDYLVGRYKNEEEAAVAYNKATDILKNKGVNINFTKNYIETLNENEYKRLYASVKISKKLMNFILV